MSFGPRDGRARFLVAVVLLSVLAGAIVFIALDSAERCPHCLGELEARGQTEDGRLQYRYCPRCVEWSLQPADEAR